MRPVYGLAEASLCVTAPPPGRRPRVERLDRSAFHHARAIEPAAPDDPQPLTFVACGRPIPRHELRIVDEREAARPPRVEGRVQFRGPSSMQGYFENPEATAAVVRDGGWIETGDLGFLDDEGDLFVTGRAKDVIIAGGRNIYPQEVEEAVADVPGIRRGCVAAFGVQDARSGTERLVVVAETRGTPPPAGSPLHTEVGAAIVAAIGVPADTIVFARPGSVPKTSSGKIRRTTTRELYESGRLHRGRASAAWQWARLVGRHLAWRAGRGLAFAGTLLYSAWIWIAVALVALPLWIAVALTRTPRQARRVVGVFSRVLLLAGGCRPHVDGRDPATLPSPAVIVANHASFLDVLLLLAVLPPTVRFGAKARLTRYPILGTILRRADYVLVQRGSRESAMALAATIDAGESLFIFPEGTFVRAPGVMPFRLGAFQVAVDTGVPVVPIALRGTRTDLARRDAAAAAGAARGGHRRAADVRRIRLGGDGGAPRRRPRVDRAGERRARRHPRRGDDRRARLTDGLRGRGGLPILGSMGISGVVAGLRPRHGCAPGRPGSSAPSAAVAGSRRRTGARRGPDRDHGPRRAAARPRRRPDRRARHRALLRPRRPRHDRG